MAKRTTRRTSAEALSVHRMRLLQGKLPEQSVLVIEDQVVIDAESRHVDEARHFEDCTLSGCYRCVLYLDDLIEPRAAAEWVSPGAVLGR